MFIFQIGNFHNHWQLIGVFFGFFQFSHQIHFQLIKSGIFPVEKLLCYFFMWNELKWNAQLPEAGWFERKWNNTKRNTVYLLAFSLISQRENEKWLVKEYKQRHKYKMLPATPAKRIERIQCIYTDKHSHFSYVFNFKLCIFEKKKEKKKKRFLNLFFAPICWAFNFHFPVGAMLNCLCQIIVIRFHVFLLNLLLLFAWKQTKHVQHAQFRILS